MASLRKRGDVWYFRFVDEDGRRVERKGCPDRRATEQMARDAQTHVSKVKDGTLDTKALRIIQESKRPIAEHVAEFIATMEAADRNAQHVRQTRILVTRTLSLARIERLHDLKPSPVMIALGRLRTNGWNGNPETRGLSQRSVQAHVIAIKSFSRWLWVEKRTSDYELLGLAKLGKLTEKRLVRRPLSDAELRTLLDSTRNAPVWQGATGVDRAMFYQVAALTGLRKSELRSLGQGSFRLADNPPTVVCEETYTKNSDPAVQPIPESLVKALVPWLASKPTDRPVFADIPEKTGTMIKTDLERCGIAPVDGSGHVVDLHSLRHGYITTLAKAGVPVKTLQSLARHKTVKLTLDVYSHVSLFDTSAAVEALPDLTPGSPESEADVLAATGTDGRLAPFLPHTGDGARGIAMETEDLAQNGESTRSGAESLEMSHPDGHSRNLRESDDRTGDVGQNLDIQSTSLRLTPGKRGTRQGSAPYLPHDTRRILNVRPDKELAVIVDAWPTLSEPIRAAVLALVQAAGKGGGR